jgi:hypothetical protein
LIERFNFYDVYGNFLPGLAFLALIWLPIGIVRQIWPGKEITSAIAALAFAYIAGHIIQTIATHALPANKAPGNRARLPSDYLLDPDSTAFRAEVKHDLALRVLNLFHLDLRIDEAVTDENLNDIASSRKNAFILARSALVSAKVESYGQQFQGLYALMRGLAAAFWMGSIYIVGWATSTDSNSCFQKVTTWGLWIGLATAIVLGFLLLFTGRMMLAALNRAMAIAVLVALFGLGARLASQVVLPRTQVLSFVIIGATGIWCGQRCFSAYRYFAEEFAKATWMDFLAYEIVASGAKKNS